MVIFHSYVNVYQRVLQKSIKVIPLSYVSSGEGTDQCTAVNESSALLCKLSISVL